MEKSSSPPGMDKTVTHVLICNVQVPEKTDLNSDSGNVISLLRQKSAQEHL